MRPLTCSESSPPAKKAKVNGPAASFFAKPVKKEKDEPKASSKARASPTKTNGKAPSSPTKGKAATKPADKKGKPLASIFNKPEPKKPKDEDEHIPNDDEEGEDEISDEEELEQEEKAASKL